MALTIADYCVTLSLTQIPGIYAVRITVDGEELPHRDTQIFRPSDVLLSSEEDVVRSLDVVLYFPEASSQQLLARQKTLTLYEGESAMGVLMEALQAGPEEDGVLPLLPDGFHVLTVRLAEDGVCHLNLPAADLELLPEGESRASDVPWHRALALFARRGDVGAGAGGRRDAYELRRGRHQPAAEALKNVKKGDYPMKKRIVCFGDSNTWGYIPVTGERYDETIRWPARLQEMLGYERCTVVEEGLTGRTTVFDDPFDPELNGMKSMPAVLRTAAPIDVLVFMLGTNDFQSHIPAGNAVSTARAVQYMLETARKLGSRPSGRGDADPAHLPVEITEDRLTFKENDVTDERSIANSRALGAHMKIVAEQLGVEFLDAGAVYQTRQGRRRPPRREGPRETGRAGL